MNRKELLRMGHPSPYTRTHPTPQWTSSKLGKEYIKAVYYHLPYLTYMQNTAEVMTNLDSILKSRDITWSTKVHLVKAMVFPVVTYGCESWTIQKAEH